MKMLKISIVLFLSFGFTIWCAKTLHDYVYQIELDAYYAKRVELQKQGYNWKEANYIALIDCGWRKPDSLYTVLINRKKK